MTPKRWEKLRPGDLVVIHKNQQVPADVVLLSSSLPDGICYVETMNLDGETNLKLKKAKDETLAFATADKLLSFEGELLRAGGEFFSEGGEFVSVGYKFMSLLLFSCYRGSLRSFYFLKT